MRRRWWVFFICYLWPLMALSGQLEAGAPPERSGYSHYTLDIAFQPERQLLSGQEIVEYVNDSRETLRAIYFWLLPNYDQEPNPYLDPSYIDALYPSGFDPAWTRIHSVTDLEGAPLPYELLEGPAIFQTYSRKDTLLRVELPKELPPGEPAKLIIRFSTKFPHSLRGDRAHYRGVYTWRFGWNPIAIPAQELIDGEYLSPQRAYYKNILPAALYDLTLTLPKSYRAVIGADHEEILEETENERKVHALSAIPVRSVPLSLSSDWRVYELAEGETPILVYYLPGGEASARLIASYAIESLKYYRERWGEYPQRRLLIAETPSTEAGFAGAAANALILLNQRLFTEKDLAVGGLLDRFLDYLIAHEVAHQWWGIGIGSDGNAEGFLSESVAQYFSITYFEDKYGAFGPNVFQLERDGLLERFVKSQFGYINLREHLEGELPYVAMVKNRFDEAIVKPQSDVKFLNASEERLYNKGYLMLRALRGLIGQEAMDRLLKAAYERSLYRIATVEQFEALAQEISGQDLREFFAASLHRDSSYEYEEEGRAPYADYGIARVDSRRKTDGTYEHRVYLFRYGGLKMPVEVVARTRSAEEQKQIWKIEDQADGRFVMVFDTESALKEVQVDPQSLVPDVDRLNNSYVIDGLPFFNRKVQILATGENDLPLDAYLIRFNPLGQILEGGFLLDHRWLLGAGFAAFVKNFGRGNTLSALVARTNEGLMGQLSWNQTFFSFPSVGLVGRLWEATDQVELTLLRRPDETGIPTLDKRYEATGRIANVVGVTWLHRELLTQRFAMWASLLTDPEAFRRVEIGLWKSVRLWTQFYLDARLSFGWGEGTLGIFHFDLQELVSYSVASGFPYVGDVRWLGQLGLNLPFQREMGYNLLNVAVLHDISERLFVRFGNTWSSLSEVDLARDLKLEIGFEVSLQGRTLGGLFPWEVVLGGALPLTVSEGEERALQFYWRFWTPLL